MLVPLSEATYTCVVVGVSGVVCLFCGNCLWQHGKQPGPSFAFVHHGGKQTGHNSLGCNGVDIVLVLVIHSHLSHITRRGVGNVHERNVSDE